jgi:hypothetical protein
MEPHQGGILNLEMKYVLVLSGRKELAKKINKVNKISHRNI